MAAAIDRIPTDCDDGRLVSGGAHFGAFLRAPLEEGGGSVGLRNLSLAKVMLRLRRGEFCIPQVASTYPFPVATLGALGTRGKLDRDISGDNRGPPAFLSL